MKKRILCLIDGFSLGGAERQLIGLAYLLKCKGYDVELCSYLRRNFYDELIESYNLYSVCLDVKGGKISKFMAVRKHIKERNYGCVIAFKDGATIGTCVLKLLGMDFRLIVSERNTTQILTRHEKIKYWLYRYANYIIPNSYSQETFIKKNFHNLAKKVFLITNFTDTDFFNPAERDYNEEKGIIVVARIARQKNIIRFLRVVKRLKDLHLKFHVTWYGDVSANEENYLVECMSLYNELEIADIMDFCHATTKIREVYQNSDIFCLPSIYEGYPNAICEAMSCGKPILCSKVCDNPYIVQEGINGLLFDPFDENDMFQVIRRMLTYDRKMLYKMGNKSREMGLASFSSEKFIKKYISLIENAN